MITDIFNQKGEKDTGRSQNLKTLKRKQKNQSDLL